MFDNPAIIALLGTVFGGAGLKLVEYTLSRSKVETDLATQIREELRGEIAGLRSELRHVETELDKWKARYYEMLDQFYKKGIKPDLDANAE